VWTSRKIPVTNELCCKTWINGCCVIWTEHWWILMCSWVIQTRHVPRRIIHPCSCICQTMRSSLQSPLTSQDHIRMWPTWQLTTASASRYEHYYLINGNIYLSIKYILLNKSEWWRSMKWYEIKNWNKRTWANIWKSRSLRLTASIKNSLER